MKRTTLSRRNLLAVLATAGVLGVGIAVPAIAAADPAATPSPTASTASTASPGGGTVGGPSGGPGGAPDRSQRESDFAAALAKELGVPQDRVAAALRKVRDQLQPAGRPDGGRPDSGRPRGGRPADWSAAMKDRLAQAVKDGKLTQEQADAITKAIDAGVLPGGPGGGWRGPGRPGQ